MDYPIRFIFPKMYEEQPAIIDWLFSYKKQDIRNPASNFKSPSQKTSIPTVTVF